MLYQRNNIYYTSYYHSGKRYRQSLHTSSKAEAISRENEFISFLTDNSITSQEIPLWRDFKRWYAVFIMQHKSAGTRYFYEQAM